MPYADFTSISVGDNLSPLALDSVTRHMLGLYAGASGDYNPVHIDADYARQKAGMPDVFAHGMLPASWLARVITRWVHPTAIKSLSVRFVAMTHVGDEAYCHASVTDKFLKGGEPYVRLELRVQDALGEIKLIGNADIALPD